MSGAGDPHGAEKVVEPEPDPETPSTPSSTRNLLAVGIATMMALGLLPFVVSGRWTPRWVAVFDLLAVLLVGALLILVLYAPRVKGSLWLGVLMLFKRLFRFESPAQASDVAEPAAGPGPGLRAFGVAAAALLFTFCAAAAVNYVRRTSFAFEGERVFSLWDDAMISMRYAKNLASGHGLVWNDGERMQGFSNLALTLVMSLVHLLPLGPNKAPLVFQLLCLGAAGATALVIGKLTRALTGHTAPGVVAAAIVASLAPLGIWAAQGADTAAIALLTALALYYLARPPAGEGLLPRALIFGAAGILVRLDFVLVYLLLLGWLATTSPGRWRTAVRGLGLLGGTLGAIFLFGQLYYGDPLPNTYYLKATGVPSHQMVASGWWQLRDQLSGWSRLPLAAAVVFLPLLLRRSKLFGLLYLLLLAFGGYFIRVGGDWVTDHTSRFLVPAVPLLVVVVVGGTWHALAPLNRRWPVVGFSLLALLVPFLAFAMSPRGSRAEWWSLDGGTMYRGVNQASVHYARLLTRITTQDTYVGVFWAGLLPYHLEGKDLEMARALELIAAQQPRAHRASSAERR